MSVFLERRREGEIHWGKKPPQPHVSTPWDLSLFSSWWHLVRIQINLSLALDQSHQYGHAEQPSSPGREVSPAVTMPAAAPPCFALSRTSPLLASANPTAAGSGPLQLSEGCIFFACSGRCGARPLGLQLRFLHQRWREPS